MDVHPERRSEAAREATVADLDYLVSWAGDLADRGQRSILGVTGAPGAGKSTLCAALLEALGDRAVLVGMDGFHFANQELLRQGTRGRKGAPDTFDVDGFVTLLGRLRAQRAGVIYAPFFDRGIEESIGSAIPVRAETPLVITEGNYLLRATGGWERVQPLLGSAWYLDVPAEVRENRLIARRQSFGHSSAEAVAWVHDVDSVNAATVEATRDRADLVVQLSTRLGSS